MADSIEMLHVLLISSMRFVSVDNPVGGIFQLDLAQALHKAGLKVGVIAPVARSLRGWKFSELGRRRTWTLEEDSGVPILRPDHYAWVPSRTPIISMWYQVMLGRKLFSQYLQRYGKPDIIHAHNGLFAGAVALSLRKKQGIPFVLTEHSSAHISGTVTWWQRNALLDVLARAERRLVVSKYLGRRMEALYGEVMEPWEWLPNVVSGEFVAAEVKDHFSDGASFNFLNIAAMLPWKNQANLLRAFAASFAMHKRVKLRIVGEGPLRGSLEDLSIELGIQDQVLFLGPLGRSEVVEELKKSDAFVLASDFETFGVVLIEALAMGRPVIATDCGGPGEIVNDGNGFLVPVGDVDALANAMSRMVEEIHRYSPIALREACIGEYGESGIVARHIAIYESVVVGEEGMLVRAASQSDLR